MNVLDMPGRRRIGLLRAALIAAGALIYFPASASAASITPNSFTDSFASADADCSLREAVSIANTDAPAVEPDCAVSGGLGDDVVRLEAGTYQLSLSGFDIVNATGDLNPNTTGGALTIDGAEAEADATTIAGPSSDRVLGWFFGSGTLTVSDLTIAGGAVSGIAGGGGILAQSTGELVVDRARVTGNASQSGPGGGIHTDATVASLEVRESSVSGNTTGGAAGGGISTAGPLTIESTVIADNEVSSDTGSNLGGGISATDTATITDSAIVGNRAIDTDATGTPSGGGIDVFAAALTIRRTTLSGNEASGGAAPEGGAIQFNGSGEDLTIVNSTLSANEAISDAGTAGSAGALRVDNGAANVVHSTFGPNPIGGTTGTSASAVDTGASIGTVVNLRGSVIETSGAADACDGSVASQGGNVLTDASCGPPAAGDEIANPMLNALADNGGPDAGAPGLAEAIETHSLQAGSTAIGQVAAADCDDALGNPLSVDQRGLPRPADFDGDAVARCDAGSLELSAPPPAGGGEGGIVVLGPSNAFEIDRVKRRKRKGTAILFLILPGPGQIGLEGKGINEVDLASKDVAVPGGVVKLKVKPAKKGKPGRRLRDRLERKGKARVTVRVTYLPVGGAANTVSKRLKLIAR